MKHPIVYFSMTMIAMNIVLAQDWSEPKSSLFKEKWRNANAHKYLQVVADFNNDNLLDTARILQSTQKTGLALMVSLAKGKEYILFNSFTAFGMDANNDTAQVHRIQSSWAKYFGIDIVKPGVYKTGCGKGYYECEKGEPKQIRLKYQGIRLFQYDADFIMYYYWDDTSKTFISNNIGG